eukprot:6214520-Pleurochrysis_carterae.AAC.1
MVDLLSPPGSLGSGGKTPKVRAQCSVLKFLISCFAGGRREGISRERASKTWTGPCWSRNLTNSGWLKSSRCTVASALIPYWRTAIYRPIVKIAMTVCLPCAILIHVQPKVALIKVPMKAATLKSIHWKCLKVGLTVRVDWANVITPPRCCLHRFHGIYGLFMSRAGAIHSACKNLYVLSCASAYDIYLKVPLALPLPVSISVKVFYDTLLAESSRAGGTNFPPLSEVQNSNHYFGLRAVLAQKRR